MTLSNFKILRYCAPFTFAEVDVTTGPWFWRKTERKTVCKEWAHWFFVDDGNYTPGNIVENLQKALRAQEALAELKSELGK